MFADDWLADEGCERLVFMGWKRGLPVLPDGHDDDEPYRALPLERWRDRDLNKGLADAR